MIMKLKAVCKTLPNGLSLLTLSLPGLKSATCLLMVKVGSRYEEDSIAGASHFIEHMVFKGTEKFPTAFDLSSRVDSIGAEFNAFTSKEYTGFYVKSASRHLNTSLEILSQLVFAPLISSLELKKEKGVIIEEINMREDLPMAQVYEDFEVLLYGLTHLGRQTIGFKKTVKGMKKQDLLSFMKGFYYPANMVLGIVGGIDKLRGLEGKVARFFNSGKKKEDRSSLSGLIFKQKQPKVFLRFKKLNQAHLCLGVRTFPRGSRHRYALSLLSIILGGNMSSRLFTEVREKRGLGYYVKTDTQSYFDNGYLVCQAGTDINRVEETIKVIIKEFSKLKDKKVGIKELKKAKEYIRGKLALSLESSNSVAGFIVEDLLLEDRIRTFKEVLKGFDKVTSKDIKEISSLIFQDKNLNLSLLGPFKDKDRFAKLLQV
jgi:predicted Zn-dependent peptidase